MVMILVLLGLMIASAGIALTNPVLGIGGVFVIVLGILFQDNRDR